jgi:signal transduction histidine kinase
MDSWYASPERLPQAELATTVEFASRNAVVDALLKTTSGLMAVLNKHRQIIAINDSFIASLGITDPSRILGLRPGEAIGCVHANDMSAGCGTSKFCATCGGAISIVAALASESPVERRCIITVERGGEPVEMCLSVRATRVVLEGHILVLLFLQDIGDRQRQVALERLFFHDISNLVMGLQGTAQMMAWKSLGDDGAGRKIARMADRLAHEIKIQRALLHDESFQYPVEIEAVRVTDVLTEICDLFASHPAAKEKRLEIAASAAAEVVLTDPHLLLRILSNMLTNAFEATEPGGEVRLEISGEDDETAFSVWNRKAIPEEYHPRIFQRYFSSKANSGRGLGTHSMKLFGEKFLGGSVSFTSNPFEGTTFTLRIPA